MTRVSDYVVMALNGEYEMDVEAHCEYVDQKEKTNIRCLHSGVSRIDKLIFLAQTYLKNTPEAYKMIIYIWVNQFTRREIVIINNEGIVFC